MSDISQKQTKVWFMLVDVLVFKDLDPPIFIEGYIIGSRLMELNAKIGKWADLKRKQCCDPQGDASICKVRPHDFDQFSDGDIQPYMEDIEKVVAEFTHLAIDAPEITPARLDPGLAQMEEGVLEELAKIQRAAEWPGNR